MQSSSSIFSAPSTATVSIVSCNVIKEDNYNVCIALLATDNSIKQKTVVRAIEQTKRPKTKMSITQMENQLALRFPSYRV